MRCLGKLRNCKRFLTSVMNMLLNRDCHQACNVFGGKGSGELSVLFGGEGG